MVNNQPPPHFDPNDSSAEPPRENRQARKNLKRTIFMLLAIGLCLGGVVSVGVVIALNRFGLSDPPSQVDRFGE